MYFGNFLQNISSKVFRVQLIFTAFTFNEMKKIKWSAKTQSLSYHALYLSKSLFVITSDYRFSTKSFIVKKDIFGFNEVELN